MPTARLLVPGQAPESPRRPERRHHRPGTDQAFGDEAVFGLVAVVGLVIGLLLVARSRPRLVGLVTWWEWAIVLVAAAAAVTASMYRVFIAGTVGANIGGGMTDFTAVPLVCAFLVAAPESLRRQGRVSLTDRTVVS